MIVLDTHVLLWVTQQPEKIGKNCTDLIQQAWASQAVAVSAISFWEIAMLQAKGRIHLQGTVQTWRSLLLNQGLKELSVDGQIGIQAAQLALHGDPADRLIAATALVHQATLCTADEKLLAWHSGLVIQDSRR
jgi:PIN domain nuclease of toxin-antitoxin system